MRSHDRHAPILPVVALLGLTIAFAASGCGTRSSAQSQFVPSPSGTTTTWVSNAGRSSQLGPEEQVGGYGIRPPLGYTAQNVTLNAPDGGGVRRIWTGPVGADGVAPYLQMDVSQDNGILSSRTSSNDEVQIGFLAAAQNHGGMKESQIEQGTINGLAFSRGYWKGTGMKTGKMFHGFVYGRIASPTIITIVARDAEPSNQQTLPLMEASALTVRKL